MNDGDKKIKKEDDTKEMKDEDAKKIKEDDTKEMKDEDAKKIKEDDTKETKDEDAKKIKEDDTKETKEDDKMIRKDTRKGSDATEELLWDAALDEVASGYVKTEDYYQCLICGHRCEEGRIYSVDDVLFDAHTAMKKHIELTHVSTLAFLLKRSAAFLGVSEVQKEILLLLSQGKSDKEISELLGCANSTIRNHRFKLREKEKQSKMFLAVMKLITNTTKRTISELEQSTLCDAHKTATTLDDRYNITDKERAATRKTYMDEYGALKSYPAKEKKKLIVLTEIAKIFVVGHVYSEKEVNKILMRIYSDYPTIRRALIEYGFLERSKDCSSYRVKE